MKTFIIYDATREGVHEKLAEVEAGNGKNALKKFRQTHCMSWDTYAIRKGGKGYWEMSGVYGSYFYAVKKEEK